MSGGTFTVQGRSMLRHRATHDNTGRATEWPTGRQRSIRAVTRAGFTLIELIVVILVIGILAAMLLPAINNVRISTRNAQVTVDIKNLEAAIANFKLKYGMEPPSSFRMHEDGAWDPSNNVDKASVAIIRQMWPEITFTTSSSAITAVPAPGDVNGNGTIETDGYTLNGAECLAFFLGGVCATADASGTPIVNQDGTAGAGSGPPKFWSPLGFSANPQKPFSRGGNRVGPFLDFVSNRLVNTVSVTTPDSSLPEYLDPLPNQTAPYWYTSAYSGRGYDKSGIGGANLDFTPTTTFFTYKNKKTGVVYNQKTYQIISPGFDGEIGVGGSYSSGTPLPDAQKYDRDNITNFSSGPLQP